MKFENIKVMNIDNAIRGMRNPLNSWDKSDSYWTYIEDKYTGELYPSQFFIGEKDLELAKKLVNGGSPHRKFLRQIFVTIDITAPIYWWKEMDQYRIGCTTNSTSTMHKLATTPITLECFETDDFDMKYSANFITEILIPYLEGLRLKYLETKDTGYWKELVRWLPEGWLQTRTWTCDYETLIAIYEQRKGHKLTEWKQFLDMIENLPYSKDFITIQ